MKNWHVMGSFRAYFNALKSSPNLVSSEKDDIKKVSNADIACSVESLMRLRFEASQFRLPSALRKTRQQTGPHRSHFRGRGMEFAEVRQYQPGDDVRTIDWRVTARRQKPHTKLFHEERERPVYILCDQRRSQFFGSQKRFKSALAGEIATFSAWSALDQGDRVGGIVFSDYGHHEIKAERKRKSVMRFIQAISDFSQHLLHPHAIDETMSETFSLDNALQEARRIVRPGSLIIMVSDFHDYSQSSTKLLSTLGRHNDIIALQTYDPLERILPPPGQYPIQSAEGIEKLNTDNVKVKNLYEHLVQERQENLKQQLNGIRIPLIELSTNDDRYQVWQRIAKFGGSAA